MFNSVMPAPILGVDRRFAAASAALVTLDSRFRGSDGESWLLDD
jgi:hypothetical protein